jgi:RNA polymerase sigma-70 factor, ECF subfamily
VRAHILDLIARKVRVRFAVDADAFAGRLLAVAAPLERLSLDDLYLATACSRGEEAAWEECATRHFGFMRDFARRYLREPAASDLADQVIADLWQRGKIARFDGRSTLRTWLGAVVAHAALNALKTSRRAVSLESEEFESWRRRQRQDVTPGAGDEETGDLLRRLVGEALRSMPAEDKLLMLLHYEQGLTLDQIGVVLGGSKSTLSRRLKRTCAALRAAVDALARERFGGSADSLRAGVDLGRLELDLASLVATHARPGPAARGVV